MLTYTSV